MHVQFWKRAQRVYSARPPVTPFGHALRADPSWAQAAAVRVVLVKIGFKHTACLGAVTVMLASLLGAGRAQGTLR